MYLNECPVISWARSHALGCCVPQTGRLCISMAASLFSFFQHIDSHSYSLMKLHENSKSIHTFVSLVDGAHIQTAQRQWLLSILCHFPGKELMYWAWSKEFKWVSFSFPSVLSAFGTSSHAECTMVTRQPTPLFTWRMYLLLIETQKSSFLELLSSR